MTRFEREVRTTHCRLTRFTYLVPLISDRSRNPTATIIQACLPCIPLACIHSTRLWHAFRSPLALPSHGLLWHALSCPGDHYFHSTFNDIVLSGLVGVRPTADYLEIHPLTSVAWFCATRLRLRGHNIAIVWDVNGERFPHGAGLHVWWDGKQVGSAAPAASDSGAVQPPRVRIDWEPPSRGRPRRFAACSRPIGESAAAWWDC